MRLTRLKERRLRIGMLQIELAQRARIARSRLSELENGYIQGTREELARLDRVLQGSERDESGNPSGVKTRAGFHGSLLR